MKLYAVFKEGVYRHECLGIFDSETPAKLIAEQSAAEDDYHHFVVVPFDINTHYPDDHEPSNIHWFNAGKRR